MRTRSHQTPWGLCILISALVVATACGGGGGGQQAGKTGGGGSGASAATLPTNTFEGWTVDTVPAGWWTRREDTPWAERPEMVGEDVKLTEDVTVEVGGQSLTFPAGTSLWWRRLKPGYDILTDELYREDRDVHFKAHHEPGTTHEYSGPGPFGNNELQIGSIGNPAKLNPILSQDTASSDIIHFTFARLIHIDHHWKPIPQLAEGFAVSPDGLQYTYFMRPGVEFTTGEEITAHDVEFTYSSILDDNVASPRKGDFKDLDRVEVVDDHTVTFHLKASFAPFLRQPTYGIMPKSAFELEENRDMNAANFNRFPIGAGPYILTRYEGEDVILERNDNYYGRRAPMDRIIFKKTPGQEIEQEYLRAHSIDLGSVLISDLDMVAKSNPEIRQFRTSVGLGYSYMGFNLKSTFFNDHRVRQAIAHAVNREDLIQKVIFGHGQLCNANIPPMSPYFNPNVKGYDYNVQRAKDLLAEAGWRAGSDGILAKDGRKFSFELLTNEGNPYRKKIAEMIQDDLKVVGIEAKPRLIEWSSFTQQFIRQHKFEAFILGWSLGVDPDDYSIFHSSQFDEGLNYGFYANARVDELLTQGQREVDETKRKAIYWEIQEELAKDLPYLFLFYNKKAGGILKRIDGLPQIEPNDTSYIVPPMDAANWFVKGFGPQDGPMLNPE